MSEGRPCRPGTAEVIRTDERGIPEAVTVKLGGVTVAHSNPTQGGVGRVVRSDRPPGRPTDPDEIKTSTGHHRPRARQIS